MKEKFEKIYGMILSHMTNFQCVKRRHGSRAPITHADMALRHGGTSDALTSRECGVFLVTDMCTGQDAQWDFSFVDAATPFTNTAVRM